MDWACVCGDVEEDCRALPPTLSESIMAAMQDPHETLGVGLNAPPWARRDALRRNCVRLLARGELLVEAHLIGLESHDDVGVPGASLQRLRPPAPHSSMIAAYVLLEAAGRRRLEPFVKRLPRLVSSGYFGGSPRDLLHTLRCRDKSGSRACAMLRCLCLGARKRDTGWEFDFEVDYCARSSMVSVTERNGGLTALAQCFSTLGKAKPSTIASRLARGDGPDDAIAGYRLGRYLARQLTGAHCDLARSGLFSGDIVRVLGIDIDRVWREEEPRIATLLDAPELRDDPQVTYCLNAEWLQRWQTWVKWRPSANTPCAPEPPGPVECVGSVRLSASLFAYFDAVHGRRGHRQARIRSHPDEPSLPARPIALAILQRAWRRSRGRQSRFHRSQLPQHCDEMCPPAETPSHESLSKQEYLCHTSPGTLSPACFRPSPRPASPDEVELVSRHIISPLHAAQLDQSSSLIITEGSDALHPSQHLSHQRLSSN